MNRNGGATCICKPGYFGAQCESDVNECASNPCRNGGTCLDQENRFVCQCPRGARGKFCEMGRFALKSRLFKSLSVIYIKFHLLFYHFSL